MSRNSMLEKIGLTAASLVALLASACSSGAAQIPSSVPSPSTPTLEATLAATPTPFPAVMPTPYRTVAPSPVPTATQQNVSPTSTPVLPEANTPSPSPTSVTAPTPVVTPSPPSPVPTPSATRSPTPVPQLQGPDLQAYAIKDRGWDAPVVIGGRQLVFGLPDDGKTYVGIGIANEGSQVARAFKTTLYVGDKLVKSWTTDELGTQRYTTGVVPLEEVVRAVRIGQGEHLFRVEVDSEKSVAEAIEGNNSFAKKLSVAFSAPDPMVASGSPVSFARAAEVLGNKALRDDPRKYVVVNVENGSSQFSAERVPVELKINGVVAYSWTVTLKPNGVATLSAEVGGIARGLKILSGTYAFEVFVNSTSSSSWVLDQNSGNNTYKASLDFRVAPEPVVRPVTSPLVQKLLELEKRGVPVDQRVYDEEISLLYRDFLKQYGFSLDGVNLTTKVMPTVEYAKERAKDYNDPSQESTILSQPLVHFANYLLHFGSAGDIISVEKKIEEGPPASFITVLAREDAGIFYAQRNLSGLRRVTSGMTDAEGREYFQDIFEAWIAAALIENGYSTLENISVLTRPLDTRLFTGPDRVWADVLPKADKRGLPFGSATSGIYLDLFQEFIALPDPVAYVAALNERAKQFSALVINVYVTSRRVNKPETELPDAVRLAVDPLGAIKCPLSLDRVLVNQDESAAPLLREDRNF